MPLMDAGRNIFADPEKSDLLGFGALSGANAVAIWVHGEALDAAGTTGLAPSTNIAHSSWRLRAKNLNSGQREPDGSISISRLDVEVIPAAVSLPVRRSPR